MTELTTEQLIENPHKPLLKSLTVVALLLMLMFNVIGEWRFEFLYDKMDIFVNAGLTIVAAFGRYRATTRIEGIVK